jgi:hypothetical protein
MEPLKWDRVTAGDTIELLCRMQTASSCAQNPIVAGNQLPAAAVDGILT